MILENIESKFKMKLQKILIRFFFTTDLYQN